MARPSAINPVANAVVTALNVASLQALCQGGVYRGVPLAQTTPYVSVGHCQEEPWSSSGTSYGAEVTVQVQVVTSAANPDGDSQLGTILSKVMDLLEARSSITVSGWVVCDVWWLRNRLGDTQAEDGSLLYVGTGEYLVQVRAA